MARHSLRTSPLRRRASDLLVLLAVAVMVSGFTAGAGGRGPAADQPHIAAGQAVPSSAFWAAKRLENEPAKLSAPASTYQGNVDQTFLNYTRQAAALPQTGHAWRSIGPFGGVVDVAGTGSGAEQFLPVGGIGTAIAADPSDPSGNTVYLGTHGGLFKSTDGGAHVTQLGAGQFARDAIGAIAVDPKNPNNLYAGTGVALFTLSDDAVGAGMYVSHDAGRTWTRPVANTHGYGVTTVVISPTGVLYAGTTYGLWESRDAGAHWGQVALPDNAAHTGPAPDPLGSWVTAIALKPGDPREVTVAVGYAFGKHRYADGRVLAPGNGLYRSTSDGTPGSFHYLASTGQLTQPAASSDPFGRTSLAYSRAPGGANILWALVADAGRTAGQHIDTPVVNSPVSLDGNTSLNGLYRSADDGKTWSLQANTQTLTATLGSTIAGLYPLGYSVGVQAFYNNWVDTDPKDPNRVYVGLEEAFQGEFRDPTGALPVPSTTFTPIEKYANACGFLTYFNTIPNNNGVSCPQPIPAYGGGTTHPDQHSVSFASLPGGGYRLYSGNDGGWFAQDAHALPDGTTGFDNNSWRSLNTPATVLPWDVTRLQDGTTLLALQDNGVAHVRKDGTAYQVCGGDGVYVFPGKDAHSYYCGIDGQLILATTDDFKTTINASSNRTGATFLSPWSVDPLNSNHLISAAADVEETLAGPASNTYDPTQELQLSTTWATVFTPGPAPHGSWDSSAVTTRGNTSYVAFCSTCRPSLATGTAATPQVVVTKIATNVRNGCAPKAGTAACWHMAASIGLPHQQIGDIAIDPRDPRTIYVGLRQELVQSADPRVVGSQKVMVSHDAGDHFTDLSGDLPRADVQRLALRGNQLIAAGDVGIFVAKAGSTSWSRLGSGLPQVPFRSMRLDATGRYLTAGAYGRGGWVYDFGAATAGAATGGPPPGTPVVSAAELPRTGLEPLSAATGLVLLGIAIWLRRGSLLLRSRR